MKHTLILFLSIFISLNIFANDPHEGTGSIKGTVTTSDGKAATEVTILIKGTAKGTTTSQIYFLSGGDERERKGLWRN